MARVKYPPGEARLRSKSLERCARVKIMLAGRPQTAGWYPLNEVSREAGAMRGASRSGVGLAFRRRRAPPSGGAARPATAERQNISQGGRSPTIGRAYARNASVTSCPFFAMYSFGTDLVYFAAF